MEEKIKILENWPYEVPWNIPLRQESYISDENWASLDYKQEKTYNTEEVYHLCRCGKTKNIPFCDWTHVAINFDGTETADNVEYLKKVRKFVWPKVDLLDTEWEYCVGARFCDAYRRVWMMVMAPLNPNDTELAIDEANKCPGGRLTIMTKEWKIIEPELKKEIVALNDPHLWVRWPLFVKWKIAVEWLNGKKYEIRNRVALCRCGFSNNKPFCDWSHIQDKYEWNWL